MYIHYILWGLRYHPSSEIVFLNTMAQLKQLTALLEYLDPGLVHITLKGLANYILRHTIVCRAAQEAGAPHRGYIDRKKENIIFTPLYLGDTLSNWNQICYRVARQPGKSTFQI